MLCNSIPKARRVILKNLMRFSIEQTRGAGKAMEIIGG